MIPLYVYTRVYCIGIWYYTSLCTVYMYCYDTDMRLHSWLHSCKYFSEILILKNAPLQIFLRYWYDTYVWYHAIPIYGVNIAHIYSILQCSILNTIARFSCSECNKWASVAKLKIIWSINAKAMPSLLKIQITFDLQFVLRCYIKINFFSAF